MTNEFSIKEDGTVVVKGAQLDCVNWTCTGPMTVAPLESMSAREVFQQLNQSRSLRHLVIGVIGPHKATPEQMRIAEHVGSTLGSLGLTLICGGRDGVMTAVSRGCRASGGLMIGILPSSQPSDANPFVDIPLPTGLGEARNMVIAKSARVLIAIGGSYGTLSEVAFGMHFSKPVIGVEKAPDVEGVLHTASADEAIEQALRALLLSAPVIEHTEYL